MSIQEENFFEIPHQPLRHAAAGELRREGEILLVGAGLPVRETLETLFDSDCQARIALFAFRFADAESFARGEALVRAVKKNFRGYLFARFDTPAAPETLEAAYAAGIDLLELPIPRADREPFLLAIDHARTIFPRWSVVASLPVTGADLAAVQADIELLLPQGILPLLSVTPTMSKSSVADLTHLFSVLQNGWHRHRAVLRPLLPILERLLPLSPPRRRGIGILLDKMETVQLHAASDLRRLLRVRQVEESFESAGL